MFNRVIFVTIFTTLSISAGTLSAQQFIPLEKLTSLLVENDKPLILVGEYSHEDVSYKNAFRDLFFSYMTELQKISPKSHVCIGLEEADPFEIALAQYKQSAHTDDDYEKTIGAYHRKLEAFIGGGIDGKFHDHPRLPKAILDLIFEKLPDVQIFAADKDLQDPKSQNWLALVRDLGAYLRDTANIPADLHEKTDQRSQDEMLVNRNPVIAKKILSKLNSGCDKVVVLIGSGHITPWFPTSAPDGQYESTKSYHPYYNTRIPIKAIQEQDTLRGVRVTHLTLMPAEGAPSLGLVQYPGYSQNYVYFPQDLK